MTTKHTDPLATELASLPQARVPDHLASSVMARISRLEDRQPAAPMHAGRATARRWPSWATALGGVVAAGALLLPEGRGLSIDLPGPVHTTFLLLRTSAGATLVLAAGLAIYLLGLFSQGNPDRSG